MAITRVQGNKRGIAGNSSSLSMTLNSSPTNGNLLIAVIGTYASYAPLVSSISQSGVTWAQQKESHSDSVYGRRVEIWAGVVGASASANLTIYLGESHSGAGSNADPVIANICEYSGLETSNFLDRTASATGVSTRTLTTGTTSPVYTTNPNELWIGGIFNVCDRTNGDDITSPSNGFELLDGEGSVYGGQTKSLAYLEKKVTTLGAAWSGAYGGTFTTYSGYAGCIATFKGIVNNDHHLLDESKWELDRWDEGSGQQPPVLGSHDQNPPGSDSTAYTYYDSRNTAGYWGNTEFEQAYDIFRSTPWGSTWPAGVVPLTAPNQKISYSAILNSVGGAWNGQGNAYIDLWVQFASQTGDENLQYAEIIIYTHQNGLESISIGDTGWRIHPDGWYFIYHHATTLNTSNYTSANVDLNALINRLASEYNCNLDIGGVIGFTFGVESKLSYIGATYDYVTYHY